jgi:hypothetical protein
MPSLINTFQYVLHPTDLILLARGKQVGKAFHNHDGKETYIRLIPILSNSIAFKNDYSIFTNHNVDVFPIYLTRLDVESVSKNSILTFTKDNVKVTLKQGFLCPLCRILLNEIRVNGKRGPCLIYHCPNDHTLCTHVLNAKTSDTSNFTCTSSLCRDTVDKCQCVDSTAVLCKKCELVLFVSPRQILKIIQFNEEELMNTVYN